MKERQNREEEDNLDTKESGEIGSSDSRKKQKILAAFIANGRQFDDRIVFDLLDCELKKRENAGQLITRDYLKGKLDRKICLEKLKTHGYNVWWSSEALWYIIKIEKYSSTAQTESLKVLSADCLMELASGTAFNNRPQHKRSRIAVLFDSELDVKDFSFDWAACI